MVDARYLTVMFTDIKGFTERTSASTRDDLVQLLKTHESLVLPILEQRNGTLVKTIGDAFLVTFQSPTNAVLAGLEIQRALGRHNSHVPDEEKIEIRVALNAGEVTEVENDVFGDTVNITARIEKLAEPNEVFMSEAVYLAVNRQELNRACQREGFKMSDMGTHALKGVAHPVRLYSLHRGLRSSSDAARRATAPHEDAEMLLEAPSGPLLSLDEEEPLERAAGRGRARRRATTRGRITAPSLRYRMEKRGLGAGLALAPFSVVAILILITAALFESVWLALVASLFLIATLPFKVGRGHTAMSLLRAASLALLIPLVIFFTGAVFRDLQRRVSTIDATLTESLESLSGLDLASIAALNAVRAAELLRAGQSRAATAHAMLLFPGDSENLWLDDEPLAAPQVRRTLRQMLSSLSKDSSDVVTLPETSVESAGEAWRGFEMVSDFTLKGKALHTDPNWKLELIGSGRFAYPNDGVVELVDTGDIVVTMPTRLGWAAQQRKWLHPFDVRWAWDVRSDDSRLKIP